ncbi:MAG: hypothetical protein M3Y51_09605 [Actinomycetota bacterium]|nr:hypothetical protein [Actinomycetota bacterium]
MTTFACAAVGMVLVLGACTAPDPAPATTTTVPPETSRRYMTDNVDLSPVASGTTEAQVDVRVRTRGCSDYDACLAGVRRSTGYTWFSAFGVNLGTSSTSSVYYGMHGGLAFGGSGHQARMYLDWSGYCPAAYGGEALRHGGTACSSASTNPTQKPHTVLNLHEDRWYRLTVRRVACEVSEVSDISGPLTGWELVLTDSTTSVAQSGGTWCLPNAPYVVHSSLFQEVIEPRGPCVTDFGSAEFRAPRFRSAAGWSGHQWALGHYNGGRTADDANCPDTDLRTVGADHIIDERMVPRTAGGNDDWFLWGP